MKRPKKPSAQMRLIGYSVLAVALLLFINEMLLTFIFLRPANIALIIGYTSMALLSLVTFQVGRCFKVLEDRLNMH